MRIAMWTLNHDATQALAEAFEGGLPAEAIGEGGTVRLYLVPVMLAAI
jgi:hypothetical protein